jgi:hypothetical protein
MPAPDSISILNRVLAILERSFPQYLRYARPYVPAGRENVMQTIEQIAAGADALAERVTQQVFQSGRLADHGDFPIEFTDTHDLSIDYLLQEAIDCVTQDVADLEECSNALRSEPAAQSLAAEALGLVMGHLELLKKAATGAVESTKFGSTPAKANDVPV